MRQGVVVYYQDKTRNIKQYRWRFKSSNGNIIAESGEGYYSLFSCRKGFKSFVANIGNGFKEVIK